ncbi:MAG: hypothetical protein ACYDAY_05975 [Candidatus Dormibacteria bacterium]
MRLKVGPVLAAGAMVFGGVAPQGVAHAASGATITDSSAVPAYGIQDSSVTGAFNGLPGCGDVIDPVVSQNRLIATWRSQETGGGAAPGTYADISSVTVTPDTFSSRSPIGPSTDSNSSTGLAYNKPESSFNSGNTAIPGLRISVHLCGSIPRDNFTTPVANGGVSYTGMQYYIFFQTPNQESKLPIGYSPTGDLLHDGPYPSSSAWYYFSGFALTAGVPTVDWGMFDPAGVLTYSSNEPDLSNLAANCATSTSGSNACLNEGGNYADGLGDQIAAAIDDDPGGACTRCVVSWFFPYQPVGQLGASTTGLPLVGPIIAGQLPASGGFTVEDAINSGDPINNLQAQSFASAVVPTPGQLQTGPLAGNVPNSLGGFIFPVDWAPGNEYCKRLSGGAAPDPTNCQQSSDNAYDLGAAPLNAVTPTAALPNPLQNAAGVETWTYNRCQAQGNDNPTSSSYPYGPYPGQTGQTAGDLSKTAACSSPAAAELSHFPEAGTYSENYNSLPSIVVALSDPLSIYGRIVVPQAPHMNPSGITAIG